MEVKVIKVSKEGEITSEVTTITGVNEGELVGKQDWKKFDGTLVERSEKEVKTKSGDVLRQYIYNDEMDDRGTQLNLETWSPTDDAVLAKILEEHKGKVSLYYEMKTDSYGTKFRIKAIQLPDGTWTAPKAKEAWKKGNAVNNRALAMQATASLFMGSLVADGGKENEKTLAEVIATADKLYEWIKAE